MHDNHTTAPDIADTNHLTYLNYVGNMPGGRPETFDTFAALVASGRYADAAALVRQDWMGLIRAGGQLLEVLEPIPTKALERYPTLATLLGLALFVVPHRRLQAEQYFLTATRAASEIRPGADPVDRVLVLTAAAVAYRLLGRPDAGTTAALAALDLLARLPRDDRATVGGLPSVYCQLGITLYYAGRVNDAIRTFERGLAEAPREGHYSAFGCLSMLAGVHALHGHLDEAGAYLELSRASGYDLADRRGYPATFYRIATALQAVERFDAAAARAELGEMVHDRRTIEHWVAISAVETAVGLIDAKPAEARADLETLVRSRGSQALTPETRRMLAPARALLELALGDPDAAEALLTQDAPDDVAAHVGQARVALAVGNPGAALAHARDLAGAPLSSRLTAELLAIELAALTLVGSAQIRTVADELAALLTRTHQRFAVALIPDADYQRVREALDRAGHHQLVQTLPSAALLPGREQHVPLTAREKVILQHLATNKSTGAIAAELHVSVNTVKTQIKSVYRKLGATTRDAALAIAHERHLIRRRPPSSRDRSAAG